MYGCAGARVRWAGILVAIALAVLMVAGTSGAVARGSGSGGIAGGGLVADGPELSPARAGSLERALAADPARSSGGASSGLQLYPFNPQGGLLWHDLYVQNFVDVDPSAGFLDYECSAFTYDGHTGHDIDIRSFSEQNIGVPVFAALDGTVLYAHDGEPDSDTGANGNPNYVILDHGGGQESWYFHLKQGSVAVSVGEFVRAGTQIGLTGSSGASTAPHLHFESQLNGVVYEPSAGACRPGPSYWVDQLPIRRDPYALAFTLSPNGFDPPDARWLPYDDAVRTDVFQSGTRTVNFRVELGTLPANSSWHVVFTRPNGSVALDSAYGFGNPTEYANPWYWWHYDVDLNRTGTWHILFSVNDTQLVDAPFVVNASGTLANRPPYPVTVAFDPAAPTAADAIFCDVDGPLAVRDPDDQIVRYHYVWKVDSSTVRDVVSAALSDAIPKGAAPAGSTVTCEVTPSDGVLTAPTATGAVTVGAADAPIISGFTPTSGITGSKLTITGSNFTGATAVTINAKNARFKLRSDSKIGATVPSGATTGRIAVTTQGGTATSATDYTVTFSIVKVTPRSGPAGTLVTLTGVGFSTASAVNFNDATASFTVLSDTKIQATVPAGATTGKVGATGPQGTITGPTFTVT